MSWRKALCKLNNAKKTRNPEIFIEFGKYFPSSNLNAKFELSKMVLGRKA